MVNYDKKVRQVGPAPLPCQPLPLRRLFPPFEQTVAVLAALQCLAAPRSPLLTHHLTPPPALFLICVKSGNSIVNGAHEAGRLSELLEGFIKK